MPAKPDRKRGGGRGAAVIAYAYASGQIGFASKLPNGALPLANDSELVIRRVVSGLARLAYDNETLLVPGIPEAPDQEAALDALMLFRGRVEAALKRAARRLAEVQS